MPWSNVFFFYPRRSVGLRWQRLRWCSVWWLNHQGSESSGAEEKDIGPRHNSPEEDSERKRRKVILRFDMCHIPTEIASWRGKIKSSVLTNFNVCLKILKAITSKCVIEFFIPYLEDRGWPLLMNFDFECLPFYCYISFLESNGLCVNDYTFYSVMQKCTDFEENWSEAFDCTLCC